MLERLWARVRSAIMSINAIRLVLEWLGWKQIVVGFLVSIAGGAWAVIQGVPTSITVMAAFCVLVGMLYLFLLPAIIGATSKGAEFRENPNRPDPEVWRHVPRFTLAQAANLLADNTPEGPQKVPQGSADGWYHALRLAVESKEIDRVPSHHDGQHTFLNVVPGNPTRTTSTYRPYEGTLIDRDNLKKFAERRSLRRAFLADN